MLTGKIQATVDREVAGSPRARELLGRLEGRRFAVEARFTPWRLTLLAEAGRLVLERGAHVSADARLSGTPLALLALVRENPTEVIRRGDVTIEGDAQIAERFQEVALLLRPDLEETLSQLIGDLPAHGVGGLLRAVTGYGRDSASTVARNVGEYVVHERAALVTSAEARQFLDEVDRLRERTDRLVARVAQLERRGSPS